MLQVADILLTIVHLVIIGFNLFGWIPKKTRKAHFISILATAASWFLLGIWFGMGYCPVTDWQWRVKEKLGEINLPNSFIEYYAEKIFNKDFDAAFINNLTAISFGVVAIISVYVFIKDRGIRTGDRLRQERGIRTGDRLRQDRGIGTGGNTGTG